MRHAYRVLQSYSAPSLGLLSLCAYSFAHDVMRLGCSPANECQQPSRRTDGLAAAPIKLHSAAAWQKACSAAGSEPAVAHVLPSHAYGGYQIHVEWTPQEPAPKSL